MSPINRGMNAAKALEAGAAKAAKSAVNRIDKTFKQTARALEGKKKSGGKFTPRRAKTSRIETNNQPSVNRRGRKANKGGGMPLRVSQGKDCICVSNTETLVTVDGHAPWTVEYVQQLVPTNVLLFPWLSGFAAKFDKYRCRKLHFRFISRLGSFVSAAPVLGSTIWTFIYDSDDPTPTSYQAMKNTKWSHELKADMNHNFDFRPTEALFNEYYVNHSGEQDLTSPGYVMFASYGLAATTQSIGSIEVDYEFDFMLPRSNPTGLLAGDHQSFVYSDTASNLVVNMASTCTQTGRPLVALTQPGGGIYSFYFAQPGRYSLHMSIATTHVATTATCALSSANLAPNDAWVLDIGSSLVNDQAVGGSLVLWSLNAELLVPDGLVNWVNGVPNINTSSSGATFSFTAGNSSAQQFYVTCNVICHSVLATGATSMRLNHTMPVAPSAIEEAVKKYLEAAKRTGKDEVEDYCLPPRPPRLIRSDVCFQCHVDIELCKCGLSLTRFARDGDAPPAPTPSRSGSKK